MRLAAELVRWVVSTQVLSSHHYKDDGNGTTCTLNAEAARAVESGHLVYYVLHNASQQCGVGLPPGDLKGSPGEVCPPAEKKHNWQVIQTQLAAFRVPYASELIAAMGSKGWVTNLLTAMKERTEYLVDQAALLSTSPPPPEDPPADTTRTTTDPRRQVATDIARSQEKFLKKVADEEATKRAEARRKANAQLLKEYVVMSLDVERYRLDLDSLGAPPLPVYTEFKNRAAVSYCHALVENMIADVSSGSASKRLDAEWEVQMAVREHARDRKTQGRRLIDHKPAVQVSRGSDHRLVLAIRDIVNDMVSRCAEPDILEQLALRDAERARDRTIVYRMQERFRAEHEVRVERDTLPLRIRKAQEKAREVVAEEEDRARRDEWVRDARAANRDYALEQAERRRLKEAAEWQAKAAERERELRRQDELEEHKAKSKMTTLHNQMRRLIVDMEVAERKDVTAEEGTKWRKLAGVATREKRLIQEELAAQQEPSVPLSSVSVGTGLSAGYTGDAYGSQYLTALEAKFLDALAQFRGDPAAAVQLLQDVRPRYQNQKLLFPSSDSGAAAMDPMMTVEGAAAADDAMKALTRQRAVRPARGEPTIGLTLAARQHATDLAHHGIANIVTHLGTDGSSLSQRLGRYGNSAGLGGACPTELVVGIVRPATRPVTPAEFILFWLLSDGDESRQSRKALFGAGPSCASVGVGHAVAQCEDRVVEVYCVIFAAEFADKAVSVMSAAHTAAVSDIAPSFLQGKRVVHPDIPLRALFSTTNLVLGRTAPAPDLKSLASPLKSPRRRRMFTPAPVVEPAPRSNDPWAMVPRAERRDPDSRKPSVRKQSAAPPPATPPEEFTVPSAKRLSPIRNRPKPPPSETDTPMSDPVRRPVEPKQRFVAAPPLPPVQQPVETPPPAQPARSQAVATSQKPPTAAFAPQPRRSTLASPYTRTVMRAAAKWLFLLRRQQHRDGEPQRLQESRMSARHCAAVFVQTTFRRYAAELRVQRMRSDRRTDRKDLEVAAAAQERDAASTTIAMAGRRMLVRNEVAKRVAWSAAESVMGVLVSVAADTWLRGRQQAQWSSRCVATLTTKGGVSVEAAQAQLAKYRGREDALLRALVEKFGPEAEHLDAVTALHRALSIDEPTPVEALVQHAGYEADYISGLDQRRARCLRSGRRWRLRTLAAHSRPEYKAALVIQHFYRRERAAERVTYLREHRPRILLKLRLARFYGKHNPTKVGEVDALAAKYVGAEERLFDALIAKYGPEP
jgi:hypothetical protein